MKLKKPDRIGILPETGFCPGCGHGVVSRLVAEVADELNINEKLVITHDVACGYIGAAMMRFDSIVCQHMDVRFQRQVDIRKFVLIILPVHIWGMGLRIP